MGMVSRDSDTGDGSGIVSVSAIANASAIVIAIAIVIVSVIGSIFVIVSAIAIAVAIAVVGAIVSAVGHLRRGRCPACSSWRRRTAEGLGLPPPRRAPGPAAPHPPRAERGVCMNGVSGRVSR